jgi:hypothetical protein
MRRLPVKLPPATDAALRRAGTRDHRDHQSQVLWYVEEGLRRDGYLTDPVPADPPVKDGDQ